MPDIGTPLAVGAALLGAGLLAALLVVLAARRRRAAKDSSGRRLAVLMRQRPDYRVLVGVPAADPNAWSVATRLNGDAVALDGGGDVPLAEVRAFVVAYPNGQLVDCEPAGLPLPEEFAGPELPPRPDIEVLRDADLREGLRHVRVSHGPSSLRPGDRDHYSTTLTNVSGRRVRVLRFGGYVRVPAGWLLHTVSGTFFSAEEFREWYGLGEEWLGPGESACDPNNYGGPPVLWAYFCQAEDGSEFVAGGVLE